MRKSIIVFGAAVLMARPSLAQESSKYNEIPLNFLDLGKGGPTIGDKPIFLRENSIAIQSPLVRLDKVERMPIAKGPVDFHSNMPMMEMGDSLRYHMPIIKEKKDW